MIVMKFGGTSVGSASRIKGVAEIVKSRLDQKPIVVVSAVSGVTDLLIKAGQEALKKNKMVGQIADIHIKIIEELGLDVSIIAKNLEELGKLLMNVYEKGDINRQEIDELMSFGERMSSKIVAAYLNKAGIKARAENAYDVGFISNSNYGDAEIIDRTYDDVAHSLKKWKEVVVVTGFIAKDVKGKITSLGRGGSDYSAAIIGAAIDAEAVEIWTDVDGIMTSDPRVVENTMSIDEISFVEASELAYFGAKVLHPKTILPAMRKKIPVIVLNTHNPTHPGTRIIKEEETVKGVVKAIAFKRNVTMINITSTRMLYAHGFLARVFEVFDKYKVSVDLVATSEVSVSITLDCPHHLEEIKKDLSKVANVEIFDDKAIISVVGKGIRDTPGVDAKIFDALARENVNVELISQGSEINLSVLVAQKDVEKGARAIHKDLFEKK